MIYIIAQKRKYNVTDDILAQKASSTTLNPQLSEYERKDAKLVIGNYGYEISFSNGLKKKKKKKKIEIVSHKEAKKMLEIYYDPQHEFSGLDNLIIKTGYSKKTVEEHVRKTKSIYSPLSY